MLRDLRRALSDAISESSEVNRTLRKIREEGYSLYLLVDCKRDANDEEPLALTEPPRLSLQIRRARLPDRQPRPLVPAVDRHRSHAPPAPAPGRLKPRPRGPTAPDFPAIWERHDFTTTHRPTPPDLLGLSRERLAEVLAPVVDRPFRVEQIYHALYERAVRDFSEMTDLSQGPAGPARRELPHRACPRSPTRHLAADGTCKYLFRLPDGATIEAVDIPDRRPPHLLHLQPGRLRPGLHLLRHRLLGRRAAT